MDELLSLFGAADGSQRSGDQEASTTPRDGAHEQSAVTTDGFGDAFGAFASDTASVGQKPLRKPTAPASTKTAVAKTNDNTSYDPLTGLRIVDRCTSRSALADAILPLTYKSCSSLAALSRAEWSSNLVDGGNGGTSGKTTLATCGILSNSVSSRVSTKTNRAFAMLSLGDMPSTSSNNSLFASVSVFLFGDALSVLRSHKKYMNPGFAVAILAPNLMPPRNDDKNGSTSITLSINDPKQILPIGRVADCDRCKGTIRIRVASDYGGTRWEDTRCGTLVDLRSGGGYCQTHRRQGLSSSGNRGNNKHNTNSTTFMQRQRMQSIQSKGVTPQVRVGKNAPRQTSSHVGTGGGRMSSSLSEALSQSGLFEPAPSITSVSKPHLLKRAPLHMKKLPGSTSIAQCNATGAVKGKLDKRKQTSISTDILGEALSRKKPRPASASSAKRKQQAPCKVFNTEGYDGAVQVPKPSALLFQRSATCLATQVTPSPAVTNGSSLESVLEKQKYLAGLLKEKGLKEKGGGAMAGKKRSAALNSESISSSKQKILNVNGITIKTQTSLGRSIQPSHQSKSDAFAMAFGDASFDRDTILSAKSRFSSAANAEQYARARSVVTQLEAREDGKNQQSKTSKQNGGKAKATASIVTTGWACRTCKKKTPYKPISCIHAKHDVRQVRELKEGAKPLGTRKERLQRHEKDAEEGGLTLGSGLEWSGWRGEKG